MPTPIARRDFVLVRDAVAREDQAAADQGHHQEHHRESGACMKNVHKHDQRTDDDAQDGETYCQPSNHVCTLAKEQIQAEDDRSEGESGDESSRGQPLDLMVGPSRQNRRCAGGPGEETGRDNQRPRHPRDHFHQHAAERECWQASKHSMTVGAGGAQVARKS